MPTSVNAWWRPIAYRVIGGLILHPTFLRSAARLAGRWGGPLSLRDDVVGVFDGPEAFSNTAHRPQLVAGDFVIGMPSGPEQADHRRSLMQHLPDARTFGQTAARHSQAFIQALEAGPSRRFDVITDYMAPIVWEVLRGAFEDRLPALPAGDPMFDHLRHIGAHLIIGGVAPPPVQVRALDSAAALSAWIHPHLPAIREAWKRPQPGTEADDAALIRDAKGLLWVGHPATVQALAVVLLELLPRRKAWDELRAQVLQAKTLEAQTRRAQAGTSMEEDLGLWSDPELRRTVREHVLEALRLFPPFPILRRDVVRDGHVGRRRQRRVQAGDTLTLLPVGALADPQAMPNGPSPMAFCPARRLRDPDDRHLMFGHGERRCIAYEQVVETLVSALIGLLLLPGLRWADPWWRRFRVDGPAITRLRLRFEAPGQRAP